MQIQNSATQPSKEVITEWFKGLQDRICAKIAETDGKSTFQEDAWQREGGGGGRTRILQNGAILEKAGVAFSAVFGEITTDMAKKLQMREGSFFATGVSIVIHPQSPMIPIIHMNIRYFESKSTTGNEISWFGGGIDLTPHYVVEEDAKFFHQQLKNTCQKHNEAYYPRFKKWADDYFFLKHRNETRGVGGIFFDRLTAEQENTSKQQLFAFVQDVGETFAPTYTQLMLKNKDLPFGETEKHWQSLRRSRYVEFNLVFDSGTKFGLETGGRTESILMSMPPKAQWEYNFQPESESKEAKTLAWLRKGVEW
jgi:coproporphyrinogen III oxidase